MFLSSLTGKKIFYALHQYVQGIQIFNRITCYLGYLMQFHLKNRMVGLYRGSFNVNLCRLCDGKLRTDFSKLGQVTGDVGDTHPRGFQPWLSCPLLITVVLWAGGWTRDSHRSLPLIPLQLQNQSYHHDGWGQRQGSRGYLVTRKCSLARQKVLPAMLGSASLSK